MKKLIFVLFLIPSFCLATGSKTLPGRVASNISMGNTNDVISKSMTLSGWFKTTENARNDFLVGKKNDINSADVGYAIYQNTTDNMIGEISDGVFQETCTSPTDSDDTWIYYTLRRNSSKSTLFENAVDLCVGAAIPIGSISSTSTFKIGNSDSTKNPAVSLAADISMSLSIYTADQIREAMYKPEVIFAGITRNFWPMWMTKGNTEVDLSDAKLDGTVTGPSFYQPSTDGPPVMYGDIQ